MTKTMWLIAALIFTLLVSQESRAAAEQANPGSPAGVRSSHSVLAKLITRATEQSATFRGLVEAIKVQDGIVYVEAGECGHNVGSCLVGITTAGRFRMLWIKLDTEKRDADLIASIGHELQHAVEILSDSGVRNGAEMFLYYLRMGRRAPGPIVFETTAAIEAGTAVRAEIRSAQSPLKND
jgi:hypothetical protein